jgi:hypothetical protein
MVFNAISWRLVLLVEKTGVLGENNQPVASHWQTFIMLYRVHLATTLVVICTDSTGRWKSNYHTITTAPEKTIRFTEEYIIGKRKRSWKGDSYCSFA